MNPSDSPKIEVEIVAHFPGGVEVEMPKGFTVKRVPIPDEPGLEPPEALVAMDPGELAEIRQKLGRDALVFVSHGRKADLIAKRAAIESALAANRSVEVHVFDKPTGGP